MPAGKVAVLCRRWDGGAGGTVHLPSPQEPVGMPAAVPSSPRAPNALSPARREAQPWWSG